MKKSWKTPSMEKLSIRETATSTYCFGGGNESGGRPSSVPSTGLTKPNFNWPSWWPFH